MKRTIVILLAFALVLSVACTARPTGESAVPEANAAEEPNPHDSGEQALSATEPEAEAALPKTVFIAVFKVYDELEENETEKKMFDFDLDGDGTPEEIVLSVDPEEDTLTIRDGGRSVTLENSSMVNRVYLCDLDAQSSYRNLVVCADQGSDDYITTVMHPEGDALIVDKQVYGYAEWDEDAFCIDERTGLFGTNSGARTYHGDAFEPDDEWLVCWMPSETDLKENRQGLFEGGTLLHLVRDLPCTIDGQPAIITKGNCILLVRFHESVSQAEICTEDGSVHAIVDIAYNEEEWHYMIDGVEQDAYFDNLFYAD